MRRARVFPLFRRFSGGKEKNRFDQADARAERRFRDSCFWIFAKSATPNPRSGSYFSFVFGGETETPHETQQKGRGESSRLWPFASW